MRPRIQLLLAVALLAGPMAVYAGDVFYDQGLTDDTATSSIGRTGSLTNFTQADEFTLASGALWTDLHFWTIEYEGAAAPSVIQFYLWDSLTVGGDADNGLILSGAVTSFDRDKRATFDITVATALQTVDRWLYSFDLPVPYALGAGTYYLGLHFGTGTSGGVQFWEYSSSVASTTDNYYRVLCSGYTGNTCNGFGNWAQQGSANKSDDLAFQLTTKVPEPGTLALLGLGLAGLGLSRRRLAA